MSFIERTKEETVRCPKCRKSVPVGYSSCPYCGYDLRGIFRLKASYELSFFDSLKRIKEISTSPLSTGVWRKIAVAPDYGGPMLVFLAISSLLMLRLVILARLPFKGVILLFAFLFSSVVLLLAFLLFSFICNKILIILGGGGDFDQTFSVLGYSAVPLFFGFLLTNILVFLLPNAPEVSAYVFFPFFIWFSYLASHGLHIAHDLSKPLAFSVVFGVFLVITGFMMI